MNHGSVSQIIIDVMAVFLVIGGLDRLFGNRLGLGARFEQGFASFMPLALGMIGFVCLAPVIARFLAPAVAPIYDLVGADPAMFAGGVLACDMGGYAVAKEMASSPEAAAFSGLILGGTLGPTVSFSIPVCLSMVDKADRPYLAKGVLCGLVTIPAGCLVGGLVAGFPLPMILVNLAPTLVFAALIAVCMRLFPRGAIHAFGYFGRFVTLVGGLGLIAAMTQALTGIALIPGLAPVTEGIATVGTIVIMLAGAYPLIAVLQKCLAKPLRALGGRIGLNEAAACGLLASAANSVPMLDMVKEMNPAGKTANFAFMVSGAFVFGDHLGFASGVDRAMILPMMAAKLTAAAFAVALALIASKRE